MRNIARFVLPMIVAAFRSVGAFRIEVVSSASGASIASCSRAMVVCVTERLPAVITTMTLSPGFSKKNILR